MRFRQSYAYYIFVSLVTIYALLVLLAPVSRQILAYYHISVLSLRFIQLTYLVPQIATWSLAYFGFTKILRYSDTISKYKDGKQMKKIALGVGVLAFGGPIVSIITNILNIITQHQPSFIATSTITSNYLALILVMCSFLYLFNGARGLLDNVRWAPTHQATQLFGIVYVIIAAGFTFLIFHKLPNSLNFSVTSRPIYYLPNWLLLTTIVIPYLYLWFIGGLAFLYMRSYRQRVKGLLYKSSVLFIEIGFFALISSIVVMQYVTTLSSKLITLKLIPLLLIIYPLLFIIALGYVFIAIGANKLRMIEES